MVVSGEETSSDVIVEGQAMLLVGETGERPMMLLLRETSEVATGEDRRCCCYCRRSTLLVEIDEVLVVKICNIASEIPKGSKV
ncbi:conserved hypothetical protein [Ricinus communis]|uniref:Uncharacterized protein n=1 Tax=Ricinus communis TaxID=3988 RepID=B9SRP4_RICCO|nr:conserved hypothetical protein [Ricinus communis]